MQPVPQLSRVNARQPRDARVDRASSLNDFASFIRNTGPASPESGNSNKSKADFAFSTQSSLSRPIMSNRSESVSAYPKLQSRDATTKRSDGLSELIDFVRSGPTHEQFSHSGPHKVVPFSSPTLSSRSSVGDPKNSDNNTPFSPKSNRYASSMNSSYTSQSALLHSSAKYKQQFSHNMKMPHQNFIMPQGETRRIIEPFPMDFSDEESEDRVILRVKPSKNEIRTNISNNSLPILQREDSKASKIPKTNYSPLSRNSFFGRRPTSPQSSSSTSNYGAGNSQKSASYSSGHKSSIDFQSGPSSTTETRTGLLQTKIKDRSYEPRSAKCTRTQTYELASFLMQNDPPPMDRPKAFNNSHSLVDLGTFQKIFGRKKNSIISRTKISKVL